MAVAGRRLGARSAQPAGSPRGAEEKGDWRRNENGCKTEANDQQRRNKKNTKKEKYTKKTEKKRKEISWRSNCIEENGRRRVMAKVTFLLGWRFAVSAQRQGSFGASAFFAL